MHRSSRKYCRNSYSITVGAGEHVAGTWRQSAFADLRLITVSYLVGACRLEGTPAELLAEQRNVLNRQRLWQ